MLERETHKQIFMSRDVTGYIDSCYIGNVTGYIDSCYIGKASCIIAVLFHQRFAFSLSLDI